MKPITALMISTLAGVTTFLLQAPGRQAHAAAFRVPDGPDWRQDMLGRDPGETGIDRRLAMITSHLDLTTEQAPRVRAILDREHNRIEALLLTAPPSLGRDQFVAERSEIRSQTRQQIDRLLTHEQLELAQAMHPAAPQRS
jgi:Spy/CpxP family protein refolding chaperone